jgi:hypothetical protein
MIFAFFLMPGAFFAVQAGFLLALILPNTFKILTCSATQFAANLQRFALVLTITRLIQKPLQSLIEIWKISLFKRQLQ